MMLRTNRGSKWAGSRPSLILYQKNDRLFLEVGRPFILIKELRIKGDDHCDH